MFKLWVIALGGVLAAVVAVALYLNMSSEEPALKHAMASDPDW